MTIIMYFLAVMAGLVVFLLVVASLWNSIFPHYSLRLGNQMFKYRFEWKIRPYSYILNSRQRVIFSLAALLLGLVAVIATAQEIDSKLRLSRTWILWVVFITTEAWIQNKLWSDRVEFKFRYLILDRKLFRDFALIVLFIGLSLGAAIFLADRDKVYSSQIQDSIPQKKVNEDKIASEIQDSPDLQEMIKGHYLSFRSNGEGKSEGLKFEIKYPSAYLSLPGNRPHIVRTFSSEGTYISVAVVPLKYAPNEIEKLEALKAENLAGSLPPETEVLSYQDGLSIDGESCSFMEFCGQRKESVGTELLTSVAFVRMYSFFFRNYLVQITCSVGSAEIQKDLLRDKFEKQKALFSYVVKSFIITSKWE